MITRPIIKGASLQNTYEVLNDIGDFGGGLQNIDLNKGTFVNVGISTDSCIFTISNVCEEANTASSFVIIMNNAVSQFILWPSTVVWPSNTEPAWTSANDIVVFSTFNQGNNWLGIKAGEY